MSSNEKLGWESLLNSDAPAGCALQAALFTTYDRADERLLVENLLPALLKLDHEPMPEGAERSYCELSALWSQFDSGIMEPVEFRRNGATQIPA